MINKNKKGLIKNKGEKMKKTENFRSNNLRFASALPYLKWLLKAIEDKDETQIKNAVINGKAYIKENKL